MTCPYKCQPHVGDRQRKGGKFVEVRCKRGENEKGEAARGKCCWKSAGKNKHLYSRRPPTEMGRRNRTTVLSRVRKAVLLPYHLGNFAGVLCGASQFARNVLSYHSFDVIGSFWRSRDVILGPHLNKYQWRWEHTRMCVLLFPRRAAYYAWRDIQVVCEHYMTWCMRTTFWQNLSLWKVSFLKNITLYIALRENSFCREILFVRVTDIYSQLF